jgi:hypothetical protein
MSVSSPARTGETAQPAAVVRRSDVLRQAAAYAGIGAALVHAAVAPQHFSEWWVFGTFFLVLAAYQALWGVLAIEPMSRLGVNVAIVVNLGTAVLWAETRLVGLPFGPDPGAREPVGAADVLTTLMELSAVAALVSSRWHATRGEDRAVRRPALIGALTAVGVAVLAAGPALALVMSGTGHGH